MFARSPLQRHGISRFSSLVKLPYEVKKVMPIPVKHAMPVIDSDSATLKGWLVPEKAREDQPPNSEIQAIKEHNKYVTMLNTLPDDAFSLDEGWRKQKSSTLVTNNADKDSTWNMMTQAMSRKDHEINPEILRTMEMYLPKNDLFRIIVLTNKSWFQAALYLYLGFVAAGVILFGDWDTLNDGKPHIFSVPRQYFWSTFGSLLSPGQEKVEIATRDLLSTTANTTVSQE